MSMKRRHFLGGLTTGLIGCWGLPVAAGSRWRPLSAKRANPVLGTARNLIFILLEGGPSHVDTFDLKTGPYTPDALGVTTIDGHLSWPAGTMPLLAERTDQFALLRAMSAVEAVHSRAVYHLLTAHRQNAALVSEIPHFGSVMSYKLQDQRRETDTLPSVVMIGSDPAQNGFLPIDHRAMRLDYDGSIPNLEHFFWGHERRLALLQGLTGLMNQPADARGDMLHFLDKSHELMADTELQDLLRIDGEGVDDTRMDFFKKQCEVAVKVITADKGARVFQLELNGWDHHDNIYTDMYGLLGLSRAFDTGFAYLLDSLAALPGVAGGSLLDETLIVAMGEFGRTTGRLNTSGGRDHWPYAAPAILAGGGVQGGHVIGATTADGAYVQDRGWSHGRAIGINDLVATMYSALGIDWGERFQDTPSGRLFEIVDSTAGPVYAVDTLFV